MINNPFAEESIISCQCCGSGEYLYNEDGNRNSYCGQCGTRIDWPEENLDGWNDIELNPPKESGDYMVKYNHGEPFKAYFSSKLMWMADGAFTYLAAPDYWRYITEEEKNGT